MGERETVPKTDPRCATAVIARTQKHGVNLSGKADEKSPGNFTATGPKQTSQTPSLSGKVSKTAVKKKNGCTLLTYNLTRVMGERETRNLGGKGVNKTKC